MEDCYWSFYNQRSHARYDGFKTIQARGFVSAIPMDQVADWITWKEGNPEWLGLSEFPELFPDHSDFTFAAESEFNLTDENEFNSQVGIEVGLEHENTYTNTKSLSAESDIERDPDKKIEETHTGVIGGIVPDDEYIKIEVLRLDKGASPEIPRPDMRKSNRYKRVVDVEIDYGKPKKLVTKSIDISTGGVLLEVHLPADAKKNVKMTLRRGQLKIEAVAQNLLDKSGFPTRRYKFLDIDLPDLLRSWLLA